MPLIVYDMVGKNNKLLAPSSHSLRMALLHMGLRAVFKGVTPSESNTLKFKSPTILKDGKRVIQSGFEAAKYLERNFPFSPTLFGGETATHLANLVECYVKDALYGPMLCFLSEELAKHLDEKEREIFLSGVILGNKNKKEYLLEINKRLNPIRLTLKKQDYLCGERPGYADYIILGLFVWAESFSGLSLLNQRDSLNNWKNSFIKKAA